MNTDRINLIFVYNADSTLFSLATDFVHKIVSPETYQCNLCRVTYGAVRMKKDWKEFIEELPYSVRFLHRDEFGNEFSDSDINDFPIVLVNDKRGLRTLVHTKKLNESRTLDEMKSLIKNSMSDIE